jgi:hypothetical protein
MSRTPTTKLHVVDNEEPVIRSEEGILLYQRGDSVLISSNPEMVYHEREIADEIMDTNWELSREPARLEQTLSEDEFNERLYNDNLLDSDISAHVNSTQTVRLYYVLSKLVDQAKTEARIVDAEALDWPYDWDEVTLYTHAGDWF